MSDTIYQFDTDAEVEPTEFGFAIIQDGRRVELSDTLANRFAINIFAARRRQDATVEAVPATAQAKGGQP